MKTEEEKKTQEKKDETPFVRKGAKDYIIARKQKKIEKLKRKIKLLN